MAFISANGTLVESYQIEQLQKAVAADLELETTEVSVEELLESQPKVEVTEVVEDQPKVEEEEEANGSNETGNDPENSEETQS